ncbi:unnamed protein product [Withania somnifera]
MATKLLVTLAICRLIVTVGFTFNPNDLLRLGLNLSTAPTHLESASMDFGGLYKAEPMAVLHPATSEDVARLVKAAYDSARGFTVSARGHGHSINGQAMTTNGVVVQMSGGSTKKLFTKVSEKFMYADVWGGELWIDVLTSTLEYGLAPKSWTDYLYLTVGGTLSNAGISGQAFNHGPQISNIHELDVVTGKGELLTCSEKENSELFQAVLGGLGQFGIITRARIALEQAPQRVRWIRVLYLNFSTFTQDQEYLISLHGKPASQKFDYVEGFVIVDEGLINNWRSSFLSTWNERSSVVTPEEDVFYLVAFLRSALDNGDESQTLDYLSNQNYEILKFCEDEKINVKQYLPHYTNQREWRDHFGEKYWTRFQQRKFEFDPRHILATGQRIFRPSFNPNTASW